MVAGLWNFVISFFHLFAWRYGTEPRRNYAKPKEEITKTPHEISKRLNNASRKDEITKCATQNDQNEREKTKNDVRNNAILNSYFSSFCLTSFLFIFFHVALFRLFHPAIMPSETVKRQKNAAEKTK